MKTYLSEANRLIGNVVVCGSFED